MALVSVRMVVMLVVVVALVTAEPTLRRRRQRCHPQVKYVTEYETVYQEVPVEKTVYREKVVPPPSIKPESRRVQQKYVTVTKTQQSYGGYGGYGH